MNKRGGLFFARLNIGSFFGDY